jgi:excisionase family DNA binding protein
LCVQCRITSNNAEVVLAKHSIYWRRKSGRGTQRPKARRINDACRALGIGRTTIYKLRGDGKIKFVKVFGRTLVPEAEIDRLSNEGADPCAP